MDHSGDQRFGDEADHERRERDPELRGGKVTGQLLRCLEQRPRPWIAALRPLLQPSAVDGDQRKLAQDEEGVGENQADERDKADSQHAGPAYPLHAALVARPLPVGDRVLEGLQLPAARDGVVIAERLPQSAAQDIVRLEGTEG